MKIYLHNESKVIVIAPAKTGSSTIERMLHTRSRWSHVFLGKRITDPKHILLDYMDPHFLKTHKVLLIVRNPFDWLISGFRWIQHTSNLNDTLYPDTLRDHLIAVKNDLVRCEHWRTHCYFQPADFYNDNFKIIKLEKFNHLTKYLKQRCNDDFEKLPDYDINHNSYVPYPEIGEFEKNLIIELTRKAAIITNYNIEESIEIYRKKYNNGDPSELSE